MLNYTSRSGDVLTMAHELGHGVHAYLAGKEQSLFQVSTPLTVAETASIFGETIVLERLLEEAPDAAARLSLLAESLDGAVAAVFRQVAMNRFEDRIHAERRDSGELSPDAFAAAWLDTQADLLGDSVEPAPEYGTWWSYVPHFVDTPGYVYAYAYGTCSRSRSIAATRRPARSSCLPTWSCSRRAARARPRTWVRSSGSTSPTRASGPQASG